MSKSRHLDLTLRIKYLLEKVFQPGNSSLPYRESEYGSVRHEAYLCNSLSGNFKFLVFSVVNFKSISSTPGTSP